MQKPMKTIILIVASFKVSNVEETIVEFREKVKDFVGRRFVIDNGTGMPSLTVTGIISRDEKNSITEKAKEKSLSVVFVETEYNVLSGSTVLL
jgi:hypothetical protein